MFALATAEHRGASAFRVAVHDDRWACCVVQPGQVLVPCGDADVVRAAGVPARRFRLIVGDAAAADALLDRWGDDPQMVVHRQTFQVVDPDRVPDEREIADPGLRHAEPADVGGLADLAVQLHLDDDYGGDPGGSERRGYRRRMERAVRRGTIFVVGPVGDPVLKIERSVDSDRYGVQLAGIVARPERRGEGLGLGAVTAAVRAALSERGGPVALHARSDNDRANRVYETAGFLPKEEWRLAIKP